MTQAEIIIILVALTAEGFAGSWYTGALHGKLGEPSPSAMPLTLAMVRTLMLVAGFLAGAAISPLFNENRINIGLLLIFFTGMKLLVETFRFNPDEKIILVDNTSTLLLWSVAGGFNVFLAGVGTGLSIEACYAALLVFFLFTLSGSYAGLKTGRSKGLRPWVRTTVLASALVIMIVTLRLLILLIF